MLAKVKHILPNTTIQRERLLPVAGRVLARRGQKVNTNDVIAEANLVTEHIMIHIAKTLRIPIDEVDKYIDFREGDPVGEDDILAERSVGFGKLIARAPRSGQIVAIQNGQVLIHTDSKPFQLRAGLTGEVTDLVADYGAFVEATGALIQGVWGNGRLDQGVMNVQIGSPDETIASSSFDVSMRGAVVLGGHCDDPNVLIAASDVPLRGLILASMPSTLIPHAQKARCPVIVLEGFGRLAMNEDAFRLLSTNDRRDVIVNAEMHENFPEIVIPLPPTANIAPLNDVNTFAVGQKVRLITHPAMGRTAIVEEIFPAAAAVESGVFAPAAYVKLEDGQRHTLPLANLEIIG